MSRAGREGHVQKRLESAPDPYGEARKILTVAERDTEDRRLAVAELESLGCCDVWGARLMEVLAPSAVVAEMDGRHPWLEVREKADRAFRDALAESSRRAATNAVKFGLAVCADRARLVHLSTVAACCEDPAWAVAYMTGWKWVKAAEYVRGGLAK